LDYKDYAMYRKIIMIHVRNFFDGIFFLTKYTNLCDDKIDPDKELAKLTDYKNVLNANTIKILVDISIKILQQIVRNALNNPRNHLNPKDLQNLQNHRDDPYYELLQLETMVEQALTFLGTK
jgi:hypothetical protein